jgi:hypothetical protein
MTTDEMVAVQDNCIKHFEKLGLTHYEAIKAYDEGISWHDLEDLQKRGCTTNLALKILAGGYLA